jgi:hypothetical protein
VAISSETELSRPILVLPMCRACSELRGHRTHGADVGGAQREHRGKKHDHARPGGTSDYLYDAAADSARPAANETGGSPLRAPGRPRV